MSYFVLRTKRFCGYLTGFVFFLSGIFKLMDPVGAGLVMKEYFEFFHTGFLDFAAKAVAVMFAIAECVIGAGLITGVWRKPMAYAACGFQGFFTILTIILVIFNPEMDCGCFGEVIHLTHWQTLIKNLILCAALAAYTFPLKAIGQPKKKKYVSFALVTASVIFFTVYSLLSIPLTDFTDFKPSTVLNTGQESGDTYEAVFVYEKDGQTKTFGIENLPDSSWNFVRTETTVTEAQQGSNATLSIYDSNGEYHDYLATEGKVMVISIYNPKRLSEGKWEKILSFADAAREEGFRAIILSAEPDEKLENVYYSDYKTLITLNRSNGGITYFNDGHLIRKWSANSLPEREELKEIAETDKNAIMIGRDTKGSLAMQGFLLYVFAVMLLL